MSKTEGADSAVLERLYELIESRRGGDPEKSYVARLLERGTSKIAQKVGEEAVEVALAAVSGKRRKVVDESADVLFHLLVLWADAGVKPEEVFAALRDREGVSGIDEKRKRKNK
jgi:phosphoribosyl-ATP pyrophosphohydrolase